MSSVRGRRYRCLECGAVIFVVPRGVLPRRRYGALAIALALALHADGASSPAVRRRVAPGPLFGDARAWRSLLRWARDPPWPVRGLAPQTTSTTRARRVAQHLASHTSAAGSLVELALAGSLVADAHRS